MRFTTLADASLAVADTSKRTEKVELLAAVLRQADADEIEAVVAFLVGTTPLGRVGVGWASLSASRPDAAEVATLAVRDVDEAIRRIDRIDGSGSAALRRAALDELFGRATSSEQRLLAGLLGGGLRQGAGDGVMVSAVANAARVPVGDVRRAAMFAGDLGTAAVAALRGGPDALAAIVLEPGRPVLPMLASSSPSPTVALADVGAGGDSGDASVESKLDGARIQAHRVGDEVRLFTRNLNDVSDRLPGVVAVVAALPGGDLVLDGEVMGVSDDDAPRAFQDTIGDFAAEASTGDEVRGASLRPWFFDVLFADGVPLVDEPFVVRRDTLRRVVPDDARVPSISTADPAEAERFFADVVAGGHEGVMVKDLTAPYEAGRRGSGWRKVKPVHTLDLVVLAVEWGSGRRRGWLSNIHLGARNDGSVPGEADFVMVGKTFKGMTDDVLRWQTERFRELEEDRGELRPWERDRGVVRVRPVQVVEIAVDGVQRSTTYPGGVALRFARVKGYRHDKGPGEADTISDVRALG